MGRAEELNKFLIPLGYYVDIPRGGDGFMIHDSISHEELRRVFHIEDILWYLVDYCNTGNIIDSIIEEPDCVRGDDPLHS